MERERYYGGDRIVQPKEIYDAKADRYVYEGKCPFCKKLVKTHNGETLRGHSCEHFDEERHGCGGTIFVFRKREGRDED